jgi:hypothetical protein
MHFELGRVHKRKTLAARLNMPLGEALVILYELAEKLKSPA